MTVEFFVDTNVLIYAGSNAADDRPKRDLARAVLSRPGIGFSAQVLQEFYSVAVGKQRLLMSHEDAVAALNALAAFPVLPISRELVLTAVELKMKFGISYWDAAIVAAAQSLGCHTILSEDLNDGQDYGGVRVSNPFASLTASSATPL